MRIDHYLRRVGVDRPVDPSFDTLRRLHRGHRRTFLFENLAIQTGGAVSVALDDIERKFLDDGGGGYCFEHNTLFAAALAAIGIESTTLLGRVRRGPPASWARTHMVLRVPIGHDVWLADVGFGALSLIDPIPFVDGATSTQLGLTYRLRRDGGLWVLAAQDAASVMDLYEFTGDPQTPADVEVANHYTSTHRLSVFRRTLTIQRVTDSERIYLRGETLGRYRDGRLTEELVPRHSLARTVREVFGIDLPAGPYISESIAHAPA